MKAKKNLTIDADLIPQSKNMLGRKLCQYLSLSNNYYVQLGKSLIHNSQQGGKDDSKLPNKGVPVLIN